MIQERALILPKPSSDPSYVWVRTQRQSACDSCKLKAGCGQSVLSKLASDKSMEFEVKNTLDARVGDVIVLEIPEEGVLAASFVMYCVPLLTMVSGAMLTASTLENEFAVILSGLLGLGIGFGWARRYSQKHKDDPRFSPSMKGLALASPVGSACI